MKKPILILLIISILFLFCACSNESNTNEKTQESIMYTSENTISDTGDTQTTTDIITITIGNSSFTARLYDNETAKAFSDVLPLTLDMNELHGNEKYYNLSKSLPTDHLNIGNVNSGDIMLYGNNCLVLFYKSFSTEYSYTKIGYIENSSNLADAVGSDNIIVSFEN